MASTSGRQTAITRLPGEAHGWAGSGNVDRPRPAEPITTVIRILDDNRTRRGQSASATETVAAAPASTEAH
jgi:hypothetical protein